MRNMGPSLQKLHILLFPLHDIIEKAEKYRQKKITDCQGFGGGYIHKVGEAQEMLH